MLKKIREKRYVNRHVKKDVKFLFSEIEEIRRKSDIIIICPTPTGNNWLGVMHATLSLFPDCTLLFPQYFTNSVYSEAELIMISKKVDDLNFKKVIFSGFVSYFSLIIENIKSAKVGVIFHGALSELSNENNQLQLILKLADSGIIHHVAFIKKGLSDYFEKIISVKSFNLNLKTSLPDVLEIIHHDDSINIGVFGNSGFNKNIHNQVAASLAIKDSKVHVICDDDFSYLDKNKRIIRYSKLERNKFMALLGSMTLNSHISFSESWGQIVTESLAMGVPCLTSNNNGIFDHDEFLAETLIVNQYDNPLAIANRLEKIIDNRDEIRKRGLDYIDKLNNISDAKLKEFIEA